MKRKKNISPIWSVLSLILIIGTAVFLPRLLFMVQDYRQIGSVDTISRVTYEVLATDTAYSRDISTRMSKLAGVGYGNVMVSPIAHSIDVTELNDLLEQVRNQHYIINLAELFPTSFGYVAETLNATSMDVCDCYIVYGDNYREGVILMFWYMEFDLPEIGSRLELVVDAETNTIYYVRLRETQSVTNQKEQSETVSVINDSDLYYDSKTYDMELLFMEEAMEAVVTQFPTMFNDYYYSYYGVYMSEVDLLSTSTFLGEHISVSENSFTMVSVLPYRTDGEASLFFRFYAETGADTDTDISIGIPIIRQMVQS